MDSILNGLKQQIPKVIVALLTFLVGLIVFKLDSLLPTHVINQLDGLLMVKVLSIAILVITFLLTWVYYLKQRNKEKINIFDYSRPEELGGVSKHNKSGELFCTSCLSENRQSPVFTYEHHWLCLYKPCSKKYPNPNNPSQLENNISRSYKHESLYDRRGL